MELTSLKSWEQLTIKDNYIFQLVMRRKHLCKQLIEKILQIKISDITYPDYEKVIVADPLKKSIRLDVYVQDAEGCVYDIEMQCANPGEEELGTRARYYQSVIDSELLEKGESYKKLNTSYVIFICTFDPFGRGQAMYTFRSTCKETKDTLELKDKEYKLFLNSRNWDTAEDPDLAAFLSYVDGRAAQGRFAGEIAETVRELQKSFTERRKYMRFAQELKEKEIAGYEKGVQDCQQKSAYKLLKLGVDPETVAQGTGLPLEEVQALAKENK